MIELIYLGSYLGLLGALTLLQIQHGNIKRADKIQNQVTYSESSSKAKIESLTWDLSKSGAGHSARLLKETPLPMPYPAATLTGTVKASTENVGLSIKYIA